MEAGHDSIAIGGSAAVVGGRASLVLFRVLTEELRGRTPLRVLLRELRGISPEDAAAALEGYAALEEAGQTFRLRQLAIAAGGNPAVGGNQAAAGFGVMRSPPVSPAEAADLVGVSAAATMLSLGQRQTRGLAERGRLQGYKDGGRWLISRESVIGERARREAAA